MSKTSFALLFLALAPAAARAQSPSVRNVAPGLLRPVELKVKCDKGEYYWPHAYSYWFVDKTTGVLSLPSVPVEVTFEGHPLTNYGARDLLGAAFEGHYSVPLDVPPGTRTLLVRAKAFDGYSASQGSCSVLVEKRAPHFELTVSALDATPDLLKSLNLPGTKYLRAVVKLWVNSGPSVMSPLKGLPVRLWLNGKEQPAVTTNESGNAVQYLKVVSSGPNEVRATFDGNLNFQKADRVSTIQVP